MLEDVIGRLLAGNDLSMPEMADAINAIMDGRCEEAEVALLLTARAGKANRSVKLPGPRWPCVNT